MLGWMNHKLESRLPGEIFRWYHSNGRKGRRTKEPLDEDKRGDSSWESLGQKGDQICHAYRKSHWIFIGRTDAESEAPILWSFPSPWDLHGPAIELTSPALSAGFFTAEPMECPSVVHRREQKFSTNSLNVFQAFLSFFLFFSLVPISFANFGLALLSEYHSFNNFNFISQLWWSSHTPFVQYACHCLIYL